MQQVQQNIHSNLPIIPQAREQKFENKLKQMLKENANNILGVKRNVVKKPWITEEIIILMDERRKFKNHSNITNIIIKNLGI